MTELCGGGKGRRAGTNEAGMVSKHPIMEAPCALGFCQPLPAPFQSLPEKPKGTAGRKEAKTK